MPCLLMFALISDSVCSLYNRQRQIVVATALERINKFDFNSPFFLVFPACPCHTSCPCIPNFVIDLAKILTLTFFGSVVCPKSHLQSVTRNPSVSYFTINTNIIMDPRNQISGTRSSWPKGVPVRYYLNRHGGCSRFG